VVLVFLISFIMVDRIMVGLPTLQSRELILKTLLSKEKVDEKIDFKELATMTEGYSGSDLKVSKLLPI
jgi:ATP-dependent Zn protease